MVAPRPVRVRRRDPETGRRKFPQDGPARAVLPATGGDRLVGEFVSTELDGFVAVVTIENPPMNQLSAPLLEELEAELDRLDADEGVRAIVLVGAGDRAFVAGADIKEFPSLRQAATGAPESGPARGSQKLGHGSEATDT